LPEFLEFVGTSPLVAHNAVFDTGFIRHNARLINRNVDNPVIDTLELSGKCFRSLKTQTGCGCKASWCFIGNHHRALDDAKACGEIFIKCLEILAEKNVKTIDDIQNVLRVVGIIRKQIHTMPLYL